MSLNEQNLKQYFDRVSGEVVAAVGQVNQKMASMQRQLDAVDEKHQRIGGGFGSKGSDSAEQIARAIVEHKDAFFASGRTRFEVASPSLSGKALTTSGLVSPVADGRFGLAEGTTYGSIRSLFAAVGLDDNGVYQVRESNTTGWKASPQSESNAKNESTAALAAVTLNVRTLAHWISISRQALDDVAGLAAYINNRLLFGLAKEIDQQVLSGDGTGENLTGLSTLATAADTSLYGTAHDFYTVVGAAMSQLQTAGFSPDFLIVHPKDAFKMRNRRDNTQQFIVPPAGLLPETIVVSPACVEGTFYCGDRSQALIRIRQQATIDVSEQHSDFFARNLCALRCEERMLLQVLSPAGFVFGSLSTSPA